MTYFIKVIVNAARNIEHSSGIVVDITPAHKHKIFAEYSLTLEYIYVYICNICVYLLSLNKYNETRRNIIRVQIMRHEV
jgi:hypothetical protein